MFQLGKHSFSHLSVCCIRSSLSTSSSSQGFACLRCVTWVVEFFAFPRASLLIQRFRAFLSRDTRRLTARKTSRASTSALQRTLHTPPFSAMASTYAFHERCQVLQAVLSLCLSRSICFLRIFTCSAHWISLCTKV